MREKCRLNPFKKYYDQSNLVSFSDKKNAPHDFPVYIDIEVTNTCNFKCLMCPTGNLSMKRKSGMMSDDVFYKVLDNIKKHKTSLRFIRFGEPTMHPKLIEYIGASNKAKIETHLNTNGSFFNSEYISDLINAGLDSIKFSFQGVDNKSYAEMRNIDFYDELTNVIKLFCEIRGEREKPYIQVSTSVTYESKKSIDEFKKYFNALVDEVTVGRTVLGRVVIEKSKLKKHEIEKIKQLKKQESTVKVYTKCPEVFDKLSINWDGKVTACCSDSDNLMVLGDIKNETLEKIWVGDKLNRYRELLSDMQHEKIDLCSSCYDYADLQRKNVQNF